MRKTVLYLLVLIILGGGVWYFLFSDKNPFSKDEAGFTVKDTGSIYRIYLADKQGNTILLKRTDAANWTLNEKYKAMPSSVNMLLYTLTRQVPMFPVPETQHNNVIKSMAANAIKVELYDKNEQPIRIFYVGGQADALEGTYMLIEGAQRPYVVNIQGLQGYLTSRYTTTFSAWRDRTICDIPAEEIQSVSVQYPSAPVNSFTLLPDGKGGFNISTDSAIIKANKYNARRGNLYSTFFTNINHEGYLNGDPGLDTIIRNAPVRCIIDIASKKGDKQHVEVHWMPLTKRSKNLITPNPETPDSYDADRFYAIINNNLDTVIIQRTTFDKIFRMGYEFYQPDDTSQRKIVVPKGAGNVIKMHNPH